MIDENDLPKLGELDWGRKLLDMILVLDRRLDELSIVVAMLQDENAKADHKEEAHGSLG
jgi:hypothetical protein